MESSNGSSRDERKVFFTRCTCPETTTEGLMGRCFITGDQCPHKKSIIAKKIKRHKENKLKVFVVMSFTPITDALYQWMLKDLITGSLHGDVDGQDVFYLDNEKITPDNIDIVRCDDSIFSSHIICESICSAIQESDLVVVDLSYDNPNVFYEFGLAIALGKKILPICYKNTYYASEGGDQDNIYSFERKQKLLESFSINACEGKRYTDTGYFEAFPFSGPDDNRNIGANLRKVFDHSLQKTDNLLLYDPSQSSARQTAGAISKAINQFSRIVTKITQGIQEEGNPAYESAKAELLAAKGMFSRGDRIMLLFSDTHIVNENKDKKEFPVEYDFGDVCRIAINQANYSIESNEQSAESRGLERNMWNYIYNCTEAQNFQHPLFVDLVKERRFPELNFMLKRDLTLDQEKPWSFTYLDVMLARAQHCHTALIDMRGNAIEALFWMGVFHGRGRFAIPIRYDDGNANTALESNSDIINNIASLLNVRLPSKAPEASGRIIADIAGLWNAYFQSKAPEAFSETVKKVLKGINQKSGHLDAWQKTQFLRSIGAWTYYPGVEDKNIGTDKIICDMEALEQYYRDVCWNVLLAHGDVLLYPTSYNKRKATVSHWDYNAIARLDNFSNQRIGAFRMVLQATLGIKPEEMERTHFSQIIFGDRDVNEIAQRKIEEAKGQAFYLRKCDVAYDQREKNSKKIWEKCRKIGCDLYLEGSCKRPLEKPLRGFGKNDGAQWEADFTSAQALEKNQKLGEIEWGTLYGQIVFLRQKESQFSIILEGTSGPATYALADLLGSNTIVTKEVERRKEDARAKAEAEAKRKKDAEIAGGAAKSEDMKEAEEAKPAKVGFHQDELFFYTLQKTMLLRCKDKLKEIRDGVRADPSWKYNDELFAPAANYLMLCLCERFLPTASERFVNDLDTRMQLFLNQLKLDTQTELAPCFDAIFKIFGEWIVWFKTVRGIAVILEVKFRRDRAIKAWDNRWPHSVRIAMGKDDRDGADQECFSIIEIKPDSDQRL